ncbi:MAG: hypothetical protein H6Q90_1404 [Deltaproteobacteria bacterium]|nr:hypothetical protein [Deltaproteobacteria bacterium]
MLRIALLASVVAACGSGSATPDGGGGVDAATSAACQEATTYSNLATIEAKIFKTSCIFSGCHNGGASDAGKLDLRAGAAFAHLVNIDAKVEVGRKLVVASDPAKSYLLLMLGQVAPQDADPPTVAPPATIGFMPQGTGNQRLCPEKRAAVERWIMMGALDN